MSESAGLLQQELEGSGLSLGMSAHAPAGRSLQTTRPRREGESILRCSCLVFSEMSTVVDFLQKDGHDHFARCLARTEVLKQDTTVPLYTVLLGAASYINDYPGIKKAANCALIVRPEVGPGRGLLELAPELHSSLLLSV